MPEVGVRGACTGLLSVKGVGALEAGGTFPAAIAAKAAPIFTALSAGGEALRRRFSGIAGPAAAASCSLSATGVTGRCKSRRWGSISAKLLQAAQTA